MSEDIEKVRSGLLSYLGLAAIKKAGHETERHADACIEALSRLEAEHKRLRLREPRQEDMEAALGDKDETFLDGWTVRRCIDCRRPVAGGPTRCYLCVGRMEGTAKAEEENKRLRADSERLRAALLKSCSLCHGSGTYWPDCDRCRDSTDDHDCPPRVPCTHPYLPDFVRTT